MMGIVILLVLEVFVAIVCLGVGLDMMPLYRSRFSDMTAEELARYWRGIIIAVVGVFPFLVTLMILM